MDAIDDESTYLSYELVVHPMTCDFINQESRHFFNVRILPLVAACSVWLGSSAILSGEETLPESSSSSSSFSIASYAMSPEEGVPPSPIDVEVVAPTVFSPSTPLRFREPLARPLRKQSTVLLEGQNGQRGNDTSVRSAGVEGNDDWTVEQSNPLRGNKGPRKLNAVVEAKKAEPIPTAPEASVADKVSSKDGADKKPATLSLKDAVEEAMPSLQMQEEQKASLPSQNEIVSDSPASQKEESPSQANAKNFDPEDNEHPAEEAVDRESSKSDAAEPMSSELLKLIQENPSGDLSLPSSPSEIQQAGNADNSELDPQSPKVVKSVQVDSKSKVTEPTSISAQAQRLRPRIDTALNYYLMRPETNVERSPWAVMHAIIPYGVESTLRADGRTVSAIGWMCFNGNCRGQRIFQPLKDGGFRPAVGAGLQGHEGQFLGILAQSKLVANYPIQVGGRRYTVEDLIEYEMRTCKSKSELTFKLLGLSHYLEQDAVWKNEQGEVWNLERLVEEELAQPIIGAACGGTHRLMGLSYALKQRRDAGLPISGHYARAEVFLKDFIAYTWTLQNPDGSFSTEWFEGRGNQQDMQRKLQTTGHIVEWLVFVLPEEELQSPRLLKAIEFLTHCLVEQRQTNWKIGPRGHALHALALYQERVFGVKPGTRRQMATTATKSQRR